MSYSRCYSSGRCCQARNAGQPHPLVRNSSLEHDHTAQRYVVDLGRHGAHQLVNAALSWLLEVAERDVEINGPASSYADGRVIDHVWGHRLPGALHDFSDLLLDALEHALASVAAQEPEAAAPIVERLAASELDVAQLLLYRTMSGNPGRFAERAAHELISDERRLRSGYTGHPYWVTRELIQAISPALSDQSFARLEERLMAWTPAWERRAEARLYRGSAQQELLSAMQAERLSGVARRRLGELARKLGSAEREPPQGVQSGFITSPIGMDAARHMSDEQWLVAIEKHRLDWLDKRGSGFVGGADQLASVFAQLAKEQPKRFVHLALRIGSDAPASYLDDLLLALLQPAAEAEEAPDDAVFALVRHVAAMSDRPGARLDRPARCYSRRPRHPRRRARHRDRRRCPSQPRRGPVGRACTFRRHVVQRRPLVARYEHSARLGGPGARTAGLASCRPGTEAAACDPGARDGPDCGRETCAARRWAD